HPQPHEQPRFQPYSERCEYWSVFLRTESRRQWTEVSASIKRRLGRCLPRFYPSSFRLTRLSRLEESTNAFKCSVRSSLHPRRALVSTLEKRSHSARRALRHLVQIGGDSSADLVELIWLASSSTSQSLQV